MSKKVKEKSNTMNKKNNEVKKKTKSRNFNSNDWKKL